MAPFDMSSASLFGLEDFGFTIRNTFIDIGPAPATCNHSASAPPMLEFWPESEHLGNDYNNEIPLHDDGLPELAPSRNTSEDASRELPFFAELSRIRTMGSLPDSAASLGDMPPASLHSSTVPATRGCTELQQYCIAERAMNEGIGRSVQELNVFQHKCRPPLEETYLHDALQVQNTFIHLTPPQESCGRLPSAPPVLLSGEFFTERKCFAPAPDIRLDGGILHHNQDSNMSSLSAKRPCGLTVESANSNLVIFWTIDERKLRSTDCSAVSPPFHFLGYPPSFRIMLLPTACRCDKGGSNFKNCKTGVLRLKCEEGMLPGTSVHFRFGLSGIYEKQPRGPVSHDFGDQLGYVRGLPEDQEQWELREAVVGGVFTVCLEMAASDEQLIAWQKM